MLSAQREAETTKGKEVAQMTGYASGASPERKQPKKQTPTKSTRYVQHMTTYQLKLIHKDLKAGQGSTKSEEVTRQRCGL